MPLKQINHRIAAQGYGDVTLERVVNGHVFRWSNGEDEADFFVGARHTNERPDNDWVDDGINFAIAARKRAYDLKFSS